MSKKSRNMADQIYLKTIAMQDIVYVKKDTLSKTNE
jgi:hypothetical protein